MAAAKAKLMQKLEKFELIERGRRIMRRPLKPSEEQRLEEISQNLIVACREGEKAIVGQLLGSVPDGATKRVIDMKDEESMCALHYAARYDHHEVVRMLVEKDVDLLSRDAEDITPLHMACKYGNLETLRVLLVAFKTKLIDVDVRDKFLSAPLHYATMRGQTECATLLLQAQANPNSEDAQLLTPAHLAASYGHSEVMRLLSGYGANLRARDVDDGTPLHFAAMEDCTEELGLLLSLTTDKKPMLLDTDAQSNTALHLAVEHGANDCSKLLLEQGLDPNLRTESGDTAMHLAARNGNAELVRVLLQNNASPQARDDANQTPLHRAAMFGHVEVIQALLDVGKVHLDPLDNDGFTPLICASWKGQTAVIRELIKRGASCTFVDRSGKTALHWAVEEKHKECVNVLLALAQGPDLTELLRASDVWDHTALHFAAMQGSPAITMVLLETGEKEYLLSARNDESMTALHLAAREGRPATCHLLVSKDASLLEDEDDNSNTPLHLAALGGHAKTVEILLKEGAPVDARNDNRWTPLDCAAAKGFSKACEVLLDSDAPVDAMDSAKMTPLMLAAQFGHEETVRSLLKDKANPELCNTRNMKPIDLAVLNGHIGVCDVLLGDTTWDRAMRPVPTAQLTSPSTYVTPFKRMIINQPEAALLALRKCRTVDADGNVTFNCALVDELLTPEENHPLYLICDFNRGDLISHPVIEALLVRKWTRFGSFAYNLNLGVYLVFLAALTVFVTDNKVRDDGNLSALSMSCQFVVVIFSGFRMITEILQMIQERARYFTSPLNLMEWALFSASMGFLLPFGGDQSIRQWGVGAVAVFLAWINLVAFLRQYGQFGVYILMFIEVMKTVVKVLLVFSLFVAGFAGSFYVLLQDQFHFSTPGRSLMKTFVMMTGEFEYSDYFQPGNLRFIGMSYFLFVVFIAIMPIVLMNLLVGLAVDDIERIASNALLERRRMQVFFLLPTQSFIVWCKETFPSWLGHIVLPGSGTERFVETTFTIKVQKPRWKEALIKWGIWYDFAVEEDPGTIAEQLRAENKALQQQVAVLKAKVNALAGIAEEHSAIIAAVAEKNDVDHELL